MIDLTPDIIQNLKSNVTTIFLTTQKEPRGIGGIFYDNLSSSNWENDFEFTKAVGEAFWKFICTSYVNIYKNLGQKNNEKIN